MKAIRKIATILLAVGMILSLAACGGTEKTLTMRGDASDQLGGIPSTDTWIMTAKNDVIQTIKEVMEIDLSEYDEETKETISSTVGNLLMETAQGIEGVTCVDRTEGNTYIVELTIDCNADTLKEVTDTGLLTLENDAERISLKQTQTSLEAQGYEVVE